MYRFMHSGKLSDLDISISNLQTAVDNRPEMALYLHVLGVCQALHFECTGDQSDIEVAILNHQRAVELTANDHPDKGSFALSLGQSLMSSTPTRSEDLRNALVAFRTASQSTTTHPQNALSGARKWAEASYMNGDFFSALEGYRRALEILPKVVWPGSSIKPRQVSLIKGGSDEVVRDACACAIKMDLFEDAVELLDSGRELVWQQGSALHTNLDALRQENSELASLADELHHVGQQLAQRTFDSLTPTDFVSVTSDAGEGEVSGRERRRLAHKWEELLGIIRSHPSFADFLKPTRFETLRQAASDGHVVIINVSKYRVDALIITASQPIQHAPLQNIDAKTIRMLFDNIIRNRPRPNASSRERQYYVTRHLRPTLRRVWHDIMVPILDMLRVRQDMDSRVPRRIWWYPTGPLTFIPIHAAGPFDGTDAIDVNRLVISSYTSTLFSLMQARKKATTLQRRPQKFLLVSHPGTPEHGHLPHTATELDQVRDAIRSAGEPSDAITLLQGTSAIVENVANALRSCSWVHFACHAIQDDFLGVDSAFLLHDGHLTLQNIAAQRVSQGQFAFLSVCHGASGMAYLPGEAMHLAATLHFVGFPNVVATMSSIMDEDGLRVSELVYRFMLLDDEPRLDCSRAAVVLNRAVNCLKDEGVTLDRWAPFIHIGV